MAEYYETIVALTDNTTGSWTASTGTNFAALIDDAWASPNDSEYITSGGGSNDVITFTGAFPSAHEWGKPIFVRIRWSVNEVSKNLSVAISQSGQWNQLVSMISADTSTGNWAVALMEYDSPVYAAHTTTSDFSSNSFEIRAVNGSSFVVYNCEVVHYGEYADYINPLYEGSTTEWTKSDTTQNLAQLLGNSLLSSTGNISTSTTTDSHDIVFEKFERNALAVGDMVQININCSSTLSSTWDFELFDESGTSLGTHTQSSFSGYSGNDRWAGLPLPITTASTNCGKMTLRVTVTQASAFTAKVSGILLSGPFKNDPTANIKANYERNLNDAHGTLARSSNAYFWDGTSITAVTTNTKRFQEEVQCARFDTYNTSGSFTWSTLKKGLLIEPQSTNLLDYSDDSFLVGNGTSGVEVTESPIMSASTIRYYYPDTSTALHRIYGIATASSYTTGGLYTASVLIKPGVDTPVIAIFAGWISGTAGNECIINPTALTYETNPNARFDNMGIIKYGSTGWYFVWVSGESRETANDPFYLGCLPTGETALSGWTGAGIDGDETWYLNHVQFEAGLSPSSPIITAGSTATRNADSNTHSYATALGAKGKIFAISHTPFYPKNGNTVLGSDQAAGAGEFEVQADYDTSGLLTMRTDDGTTVVDETTTAIDPYTKTAIQIEAKGSDGDQKTYVWQDGTQLGTEATHGVADTDVLDGSQIVIEGFGGIIHKFGIEDSDY